MRRMVSLLLFFLLILGDCRDQDGILFGIQGICPNDFCWNVRLDLKNISIPTTLGGPQDMGQVVPYTDKFTLLKWGRYSSYDEVHGRYFFVLSDPSVPPPFEATLYRLFIIDLNSWNTTGNLAVTNITLPFDLHQSKLTSISFDSTTQTLFAIFDDQIATIDVTDGSVSKLGPLWKENIIVPQLATAYDSKAGNYFILVLDVGTGLYRILTYNTRNQSAILIPPVGVDSKGRQDVQVYIQYYAAGDSLVAVANGQLGGTIQTINYQTGDWKTLVPYDNFPNDEYDVLFPTPYYNQLSFIDQARGLFWFNLGYAETEDTGTIMYYNVSEQKSICCYSYDTLVTDFTNYLFIPFPVNNDMSSAPQTQSHRPSETKSVPVTSNSINSLKRKSRKPSAPGALPTGYILSMAAACVDRECKNSSLNLNQIQLNFTTTINEIAQVTPPLPTLLTETLGRFATFDSSSEPGRYLFVSDQELHSPRYVLYSVDLSSTPATVKTMPLDTSFDDLILTSIEYDSVAFKLFAIFNQSIWVLDEGTGKGVSLAPYYAPNPWAFPNYYISTYDSNAGNYFISVYDLFDDNYKLVVFNTRTLTSVLTPPLGLWYENEADGAVDFDKALYRDIQYYAEWDQILAIADSNRWDGSIEAIDYKAGTWVDLLDRYMFPYDDYAVPEPPKEMRQGLSFIREDGLYFILDNLSEENQDLVMYNLTQKINEDYAVTDASELSADNTNYIFISQEIV